jgi:hypothetical protein
LLQADAIRTNAGMRSDRTSRETFILRLSADQRGPISGSGSLEDSSKSCEEPISRVSRAHR